MFMGRIPRIESPRSTSRLTLRSLAATGESSKNEIYPIYHAGVCGLRRAAGFKRQTDVDWRMNWARILIVSRRVDLSSLSFWQLQALGWSCFYVLVLVANLPYLKLEGVFRDGTVAVVVMFLASLVLRVICRSLVR